MPQTLIELGGKSEAPIISLAPANGFVPETYLPMLAPFTDAYRVVSPPPKALWGDGEPPDITPDYSWLDLTYDMLDAYATFGLKDVIAIGHSIGGVMTLLAAIQQPDLFRAIILLDPVILPPEICNYLSEQRQQGGVVNQHMVEGARKRRNSFASVDEAFHNFHGKSIFADWSDEVLRLYVEHGTIACEDGSRCLKWSPEWEAFYYGIYYTELWDELPKLKDLSVPMLFISGGNSDTFFPNTVQTVKDLLPNATFKSIEGHGHLFPQSAPQATAAVISEWLAENFR